MKVRDIIEAYGEIDEPAYGLSKAAVRQQNGDIANQNKRANNQAQNANDETNIKANQSYYSQKRKVVTPTGIPSRLLASQSPGSPAV
tara:strand:+ start:951 stop:1211 length:261 start_codon:yes stop_codon:yes gene_type:complete